MRKAIVGLFLVALISTLTPSRLSAVTISTAVVPIDPSISVRLIREFPPTDCNSAPEPRHWECYWNQYGGGVAVSYGFDAVGNFYDIGFGNIRAPSGDLSFMLRRTTPNGTEEPLAYLLQAECDEDGCTQNYNQYDYLGFDQGRFDTTNGRFYLVVKATRQTLQGATDIKIGVLEISGLPKLYDTLLTFIPGGQSLSLLTPAHPDGFRSADSLQVWTGDVRSMPNWSQSRPLTCDAATSPTPGQIVTVADTLPDPAPGQVRFYLSASVNGPDRRLGRQYVNNAFSARDPAALPICQEHSHD